MHRLIYFLLLSSTLFHVVLAEITERKNYQDSVKCPDKALIYKYRILPLKPHNEPSILRIICGTNLNENESLHRVLFEPAKWSSTKSLDSPDNKTKEFEIGANCHPNSGKFPGVTHFNSKYRIIV